MQNNDNNDDDNDDNNNDDLDTRVFEGRLTEIENNMAKEFRFSSLLRNNVNERWTLVQTRKLLSALMVNVSFVRLVIQLVYCPLPAIPLLVQYIQSNPRLEHVELGYRPFPANYIPDSEEIQQKYQSQVGGILRAVLRNPSIKKLVAYELGDCAQEVFDLLSETTTLACFELDDTNTCFQITPEIARAVAGGLARNSSLVEASLCLRNNLLDIVASGISASSIKSLTVYLSGSPSEFYAVLSKVLPTSSSLKKLTVTDDYDNDDDGIEQLFCALSEPGCARLEELVLKEVVIKSYCTLLSNVVNRTLQILVLDNITVPNRQCVRQLWHLVGLKELRVRYPNYNTSNDADCFPEVVQRNPTLLKISVVDNAWNDCAEGLVSGACGHPSIETLDLDFSEWDYIDLDKQIGSQLCRLLRQTKPLKSLRLAGFNITERQGGELLVEGICQSTSLQHFTVTFCRLSFPALQVMVESFLFNHSVKTFEIDYCEIEGDDSDYRPFCKTLCNVFRVNSSLVSFTVPSMNMNAENGLMSVLVDDGFFHNKTIKFIDLSWCTLDQAACTSLEQALVGKDDTNALSLSSIKLPNVETDESMNPFLRNLARMPFIERVTFKGVLDTQAKQLLLQAVKEKKTLFSFDRKTSVNSNMDPIDVEIDFYLKLNRFGRRIVESPNAQSSLFPLILSRMTTIDPNTQQPRHADALFYFVCKYFSMQQHDSNQQGNDQEQASPCKRARLE